METGERLFCKHCKTCAMSFRIWVIFSFRRRKNLCNFFTSNKGENSYRIWEQMRKEDEDCCVIVERGWLISFVPVYITGEQRSRYRILFKRQKKIENKRRQGSREQRTIYQILTGGINKNSDQFKRRIKERGFLTRYSLLNSNSEKASWRSSQESSKAVRIGSLEVDMIPLYGRVTWSILTRTALHCCWPNNPTRLTMGNIRLGPWWGDMVKGGKQWQSLALCKSLTQLMKRANTLLESDMRVTWVMDEASLLC